MQKQRLSLNQELNNLTRRLHKQNAELARLNQEKNQFLGMAAHELRKLIGRVLTYSEFLLDEAVRDLEPEHQNFLSTIHDRSLFMKHLVDDFLDVSAIEARRFDLNLQPADMPNVLSKSLEINRLQARKKGVDLQVDMGPCPKPVVIDVPKIEQAVTNYDPKISNCAIRRNHGRNPGTCHEKQGYKVGDVRGGISVTFDVSDTEQKMARNRFGFIGLGIAASLALLGIVLFLISRLAGSLSKVDPDPT